MRFVVPAAIVFVLVAVSLFLRTNSLGESLWMDEGLSIGIASQPLFDIPGVLRVDAIHQDVTFTRAMRSAVDAELRALAGWLGLGAVKVA